MAASRASRGLALGGVLLAIIGCARLAVDRLYALRLERAPGERSWTASLPLALKAGGGMIHGANARLVELELDTDAVHLGSASCHHGPPITSPVSVEARAFYTDREVFLDLRWADPTNDRAPRSWRRGPEGWRLEEGDQDGVAVLWSRTASPYGCQEACHMRDFAIRQGELVDLRAMLLVDAGDWEEAWVWKPAQGAQALTLGAGGFQATGGEVYRTLNSKAAFDPTLTPEARRAGTFGPSDSPLHDAVGGPLAPVAYEAPAYRYASGDGGLSAVAERTARGWRVVFSRALQAGPGRQAFAPGQSYRFGLAVFDSTSINHHIARDTKIMQLVLPAPGGTAPAAVSSAGDPAGDDAGVF